MKKQINKTTNKIINNEKTVSAHEFLLICNSININNTIKKQVKFYEIV